jgi:hypothetical protein
MALGSTAPVSMEVADIADITGGNAARPAPRPGEDTLWQWLEDMAHESERVRNHEARFDMFDRWLKIYYGEHWDHAMPSYKPPVVVNELRTLVMAEASDLSDARFRPYVMKDPRRGERDVNAERALRAIWEREQVELKLAYAVVWALILGTGFLRVQWDPDGFHGMGDVTVEDVDPRRMLPDPDAIDDRKWLYCIVESTMDVTEIRRLFPISGYRVLPEERWSLRNKARLEPDTLKWHGYEGPLTDDSLLGRGVLGYKKARARVLDCFVLDDGVERVVSARKNPDGSTYYDENGNQAYDEQIRARYPNGRRIIGANGVILYDGPNVNPNGDFGILRVSLEPTLGRFWGSGFIQQTGELQLAADKLMSNIVENSIRLNNGIIKATANTGVDWESFTSMPGQIVQINPNSDFNIIYPQPMPPDMVQAPWRMLDMQRRILGFHENRLGQGQAGNTSAELTETEISQSLGPTRLRAKLLYFTVKRLAEMIFARMAYGYTTERVIPAVEGESFKPVVWEPLTDPARYYTYVDPASFQIMSQTMLKRLSLALLKAGAIDTQSALETIGWPDWEMVSERMAKAAEAKVQQEMQLAWLKHKRSR